MKTKECSLTKAEVKDLAKKLDSEVKKLKKAISSLENDVNKYQKGDNVKPYWNGLEAYNWTRSTLAHIDHDKVLLEHLEKCSDYLSASVKGGSVF